MRFNPIEKLGYDAELRKCDVDAVLEWTKKSNLPILNEFQVQLFLKASEFHIEETKRRIFGFISMKTCKDTIRYPDLQDTLFQNAINTSLQAILPIKSKPNQRVYLMKLIDPNPELFNHSYHLKLIDVVGILDLYKYGNFAKLSLVIDSDNTTFAHLPGFNLIHLRDFTYYSQYFPCAIEAIHVINGNFAMDKLFSFIAPLVDNEFLKLVKIHTSNWKETLPDFISDSLPSDFGGSAPSLKQLHDEMVKTVHENYYIIDGINAQLGSEKVEDKFSSDGSFKNLGID